MMNKWEELKKLMKADISHAVHYSSDKNYEHGVTQRYLEMMEQLEKQESKDTTLHVQKMAVKDTGFLFTDVPEFDRATWKKMLENLEGLS
jgi:hypothetical protein